MKRPTPSSLSLSSHTIKPSTTMLTYGPHCRGVSMKRRRRCCTNMIRSDCNVGGFCVTHNSSWGLQCLCILLFVGRTTALMMANPFSRRGGNMALTRSTRAMGCCDILRIQKSSMGRIISYSRIHPLHSAKGDASESEYSAVDDVEDDEEYYRGDEVDDVGAEVYYGRFISEALKEEEMIKGAKPQEDVGAASTDYESDPPGKDGDALSETKRMMEQQQQQIDLLMKMVQQQQQQGRQQLSPVPSPTNLGPSAASSASSPSANQRSINVAPLKAMLFIDGTWLYYSLNTRNPSRDPLIPKFGQGWQNHYKVDWMALPRLICAEIEKQRSSKTSFSGSDRPLEVSRVMVFTSAKKETDPNSRRMRMFREMANANYDVHMMETTGQGEKCVDIQLAVEMLHYATVPNAYDVAILLSGDKDFVPALVRTRQKGKQLCISSMRAGCNRVLYESPHIRDYDVVWLENFLDELIVPISSEERNRRDRAGYASSFTMMRIVRDFVEAAALNHEWVSSRDIGKYLKSIDIGDSNMLEELKQCFGGLRTFLMERAQALFEVKFPDPGAIRGRGEYSFWVRVKGDSDETLLNEFKRTQFFTKEEKEFLESYKKAAYLEDAYQHTTMASSLLDARDGDDFHDPGSELDSVDGAVNMASVPALDYSQLTVVRLKDICREKGLPVSGKKGELIERLEEDRRLEHEVMEKQRREAQGISKNKRNPKRSPRDSPSNPFSSGIPGASSTGNNIYAATLPQLDAASTYGNTRGGSASVDAAVSAHLEALIKEYLTASGGKAGSRDIGRYLAANSDSRKGNRSALTELKDAYGSLLTFVLSRSDTFSVLDKKPVKSGNGNDLGFPIMLKR